MTSTDVARAIGEGGDPVDHPLLLVGRKLREDRQRQHLGGRSLGLGQIARPVAQVAETLLLVQAQG